MRRLALLAALLALPLAALPLTAQAEDPKPPEWKGTVGVGLIVQTGNTDATTFAGSATASRETFGWILSAKADGSYGENRKLTEDTGGITSYKGTLQLRLDRKFGETWTVFVIGGVETDHVASIEYRTVTEAGASAQWLDVKEADWQRLALRTDLGLRYGYEARYQYYGALPAGQASAALPGVELIAPRLGLSFRYGFSKEVFVTEEAEVMAGLEGATRWLAKSVTKLSSRLTQSMTLGVAYQVTSDSAPAPGKEKVDTGLTALLEVGF